MFPSASPRGTLRVSGKQNSLFPLGPVIKCLLYSSNKGFSQIPVKSFVCTDGVLKSTHADVCLTRLASTQEKKIKYAKKQ